jgi:hypothetical protein
MTNELDALKERRGELERRVAELKGTQAALYTPGITLVPQASPPPPHEIDQEVAQLEAAIVELDAEIAAASKQP